MIFKTITDDVTGLNKSISTFGVTLKDLKENGLNAFSRNKPLLSDFDIKSLKSYNYDIENGIPLQEAYNKNLKNCSESAKKLAKEAEMLSKETGNATVSTEKMSASTEKLSISAKAGSFALKALSVAANMIVISAITYVIGEIINSNQEMISILNEASQSFKENNDLIEENKGKIIELREELDTENLSYKDATDKRNQLLDIQSSLIESYGSEAEGIDLVNGSLEEQLGLLDQINNKKLQEAINKANEYTTGQKFSNFGENLSNYFRNILNGDFSKESWEWNDNALGSNVDNAIEKVDYFRSSFKALQDESLNDIIDSFENITRLGDEFYISGNAEDVKNTITELQTQLQGSSNYSDKLNSQLTKIYNNADNILSDYKDAYDLGKMQQIVQDDTLSDYYNKITDAYNNYKDAISKNDENLTKQTLNDYRNLLSEMSNNEIISNSMFRYFTEMYPELKTEVDNWEFDVKIVPELDNNKSDLSKNIDSLSEFTIEDLSRKYTEIINGTTGGLSSVQKEALINIHGMANECGMTLDEFLNKLYEAGKLQSQVAIDNENLQKISDNTTTEITQSLSDKFKELWDSESFADAKEDLAGLASESKITASDINDLAKENVELADLLDESGMSAQFVAECFDSMCRGGKGFDAITSDALLLDQVLNGMTGSLEQATQAKSEYDKAMSKEDYNANFKNYQEAYSSAMEMFENGEYGKHFRDTMEYLLGADSYTMSIDELRTAIQNLGSVFGESATNGYEFLDKLYTNKEILDDMDSSLTKLSDGSYDFDLKPDEFEEIAKALGMTTEEVAACTNALGMFGDYSSYDLDELELALNSISIAAHDGEKSITSLQGVENILSDLGYSGYDVYQIMQQIQGMGTIELIDFEEGNLDDTLSKLKELENVKIDGSNIDLDSLITGMQALGNSDIDIANFIDRLNGQFNLTDAQGKLVDFETAKNKALSATENGVSDDLNKIDEDTVKTTGDVSNLNTEVDTLNKKNLSQVQLQFVNVSTAANTAKENVQKIIDKINTLNNSKISVKSSTTTEKSDGKGYRGTVGNAFAKGTTSKYENVPNLPITGYNGLPKDEKNALRSEYGQPELTVYPNGKTELTSQPTMSDLPKGTVIYNEEQTKKILNNADNIYGKAYASGSAKKNTYTSTKTSTGNNTGKSKSNNNDKDKDKSKTLIDWIVRRFDVLKTKAERWLNIIENATDPKRLDSYYKKLEDNYKKQVKSYADGATRYLQKANSIKLDASLKNKVQSKDSSIFNKDGSMKSYKTLIKNYGEKTAQKIQDYQNYIDKYESALDDFIEATQNLYQVPIEKAANKIELLSKSMDLLDAKLENISVDDYVEANKNLDKQAEIAKQQLVANQEALKTAQGNYNSTKSAIAKKSNLESNDLAGNKKTREASKKAIKDAVAKGQEIDLSLYKAGSSGYKAAVKYNAALKAQKDATDELAISQEEYTKTLRENEKAKFDNIQNAYESKIGLLDNSMQSLDNKISEIEASGANVNKSYYESQKKVNDDIKKSYEEEKAQLEAQLPYITQGTDEWYKAKDSIQECDNKISDCVKTTKELNNAINELHFQMFEDIGDSIDRVITEQEFLRGLFAHEKKVDSETGGFTDAGIANLGSLSASYYLSKEKVKNDKAEVDELQRMYNEYQKTNSLDSLKSEALGLDYSTLSIDEFLEDFHNAIDVYQNDIKDTYSIESDIADAVKEKYQAELDLLDDLISKRKEDLSLQKDLHDYALSIQEKTTDINTIRKQIAALTGDTSQEGMSRKQKLQSDLETKQKDLKETEYERSIQTQTDMLTKLNEEANELMQKKMDDFMELVRTGLETANANTANVDAYLSKIASQNGYTEETKGLFTGVSGTVSGSIETNAQNIVNKLEEDIKSRSGTETPKEENPNPTPTTPTTTTTNAPEIQPNNTGSNALQATPITTITTPQATATSVSGTSSATAVYDSSNKSKVTKSRTLDFIKNNATHKLGKNEKAKTDVNDVISKKIKKGYTIPKLQDLADYLGVKYDNGSKSGNLYKKLKSLKISGFKRGGVIPVDSLGKQVKANGDSTLVSANPGERILTPVQNDLFEKFVNNLPELNQMTELIKPVVEMPKMPDIQPVDRNVGNYVNIDNITLPNVTNYEEFKKQMYHDMQNEKPFENMVRSMTVDRAMGAGRLSKFRQKF